MKMYRPISWTDALIARLKAAARVDSDAALAASLETSKQNLNNHKARGRFPEKLLRRAADRFGVDYEWLARGDGPARPAVSDLGAARTASVSPVSYDAPNVTLAVADLRKHPTCAPWVSALIAILTSKDPGSRLGIQENINAFLARLGRPELSAAAAPKSRRPSRAGPEGHPDNKRQKKRTAAGGAR